MIGGSGLTLPASPIIAMTSVVSVREEIASALTHGLGAVAALAGRAVPLTLAAT